MCPFLRSLLCAQPKDVYATDFFLRHRTHNNRLISMPAAAADAGSNASLASTSAQTSPRCVARASAKSNTLVLPDEAVPQISVRQPRARPPVSESSCGMPLETISGAGRTSRREAGTTAASSEMAPHVGQNLRGLLCGFLRGRARGRARRRKSQRKIKSGPWPPMKKSERQTYFFAIVSLLLSGNAEGRISPGEVRSFRFLFA